MISTRRAQRGYVLIMVLGVLLVLSIVLASLYTQSSENLYASHALVGQKVASSRADQAAQIGIALVKSGGVSAAQFVNVCTGPATSLRNGNCVGVDILTAGLAEGATGDYMTGNGWQYQYWLYRRDPILPDGGPGSYNPQLINIYAEGYYGKGDAGTGNFAIAAVEAEVLIPLPSGGAPVFDGDYNVYH